MSANVIALQALSFAQDIRHCHAILRRGSKSFTTASLLLPKRIREPAAAIYAFCRLADDAVDTQENPLEALNELHLKLTQLYYHHEQSDPVNRALGQVVRSYKIPKIVFDALLEGFLWDAQGRKYNTLAELTAYCVRVASTVGVMMTMLMGQRDPWTLARACDLGVAMQLTNIARDVGEDARQNRVYIPLDWLREANLDIHQLLHHPSDSPELGQVVKKLLDYAQMLYTQANLGIAHLPSDCQAAILAASWIYADIGRVIRKHDYATVSQRRYVSRFRKLFLAAKAFTKKPPTSRPGENLLHLSEIEKLVALCEQDDLRSQITMVL